MMKCNKYKHIEQAIGTHLLAIDELQPLLPANLEGLCLLLGRGIRVVDGHVSNEVAWRGQQVKVNNKT